MALNILSQFDCKRRITYFTAVTEGTSELRGYLNKEVLNTRKNQPNKRIISSTSVLQRMLSRNRRVADDARQEEEKGDKAANETNSSEMSKQLPIVLRDIRTPAIKSIGYIQKQTK